MRPWKGLNIETEGTGISTFLSEQVNLLGELLGQVIRTEGGEAILQQVQDLRTLCKKAITSGNPHYCQQAADRIAKLDLPEIIWLLRAYTAFFHLVNQAEQQEIIRINRERAHQSSKEQPREDSVAEAIHALYTKGYNQEQVLAILERLDIQPTLTAHPTEARRRSILFKQKHVAALLSRLRDVNLTPDEREHVLADLYNQIALLLATAEVRAERPTVEVEVEHGLYFLRTAIWETAPRLAQDVRRAMETYYGQMGDLPVFLRFRSWIGSDRDGNPFVTPDVTRTTAQMLRDATLEQYYTELRNLRRELSISEQHVAIPEALRDSLARDAHVIRVDETRARQYKHEPFRMKVSYMMEHVRLLLESPGAAPSYTSADFRDDLALLQETLIDCGFEDVARYGLLARVQALADTFGFHMAALDVRQHSRIHEEAIDTLLRMANVHDAYHTLDEAARVDLLTHELADPRPLLPRGLSLDGSAERALNTMLVIQELLDRDSHAVSSYIISMTHSVSDLLEVMLLAKEVGLWQYHDGDVTCPIDIVPLFETVEDLDEADTRLQALFEHPLYKAHLKARNGMQEIMLGYSDSNKDGGYWMANWALHRAQGRIGAVCRRFDVDFRLFHGRGGTVGRGGGRANQAILAMPDTAHTGRIRFTEQGEVISFRYALPEIARRHLEQIANAMIRATDRGLTAKAEPPSDSEAYTVMSRVADAAMQSYRGLIDDPQFWSWYTQATPIEHISRLPIASRPVSRKSSAEVDFESLRAIPWNFAWAQPRYMIPGWYGLGHALHTLLDDADLRPQLQQWYQTWPIFQAIVNNAQREMARARFEIAEQYAANGSSSEVFMARIKHDYERAKAAILSITQQEELLEHTPVIQKSIRLRNPYTDVLNLLQLELLRRNRKAMDDEREDLRNALFLSINGIAAALQSTG